MLNNLYKQNSANYPRLETDMFFADYNNLCKFGEITDETIKFIEDFQLMESSRWARFVNQFKERSDDSDFGWRGEYWGKMMRGACFVYSYTKNAELYDILKMTVQDMIASADDDGRISSYSKEFEANGWDMWSRKYVLLGMQYFLEICDDDTFAEKIIKSMEKQVDCIMDIIGNEEGKKSINITTEFWRGLNSSSILEPVVRLYSLTKEQKYLDFAKYIVDSGGTEIINIFKLAKEDNLYPYQYPITKAYEMISCFEGLLEYYRITKVDWYKEAILKFADKLLESDFTIIGGSGCTHELFDHSTVRQANTTNGNVMQETCVTVTMMKFFYQLLLLTGDSKFADAFELAYYNAYLGSVNTEKVVEPMIKNEHPDWIAEALPFDSYSPLTSGTRGNGIGGLKVMSDGHYYGCCACIGAAGAGLVPKVALMKTRNGLSYNMFIKGIVKTTSPKGNTINIETITEFPKKGNVKVVVEAKENEEFELLIRNPRWSEKTFASVDGEKVEAKDGYFRINRDWNGLTEIEIELDMRIKVIYPVSYGEQIIMTDVLGEPFYVLPKFDKEDEKAKYHIALKRGPIVLAQDSRFGYNIDEAVDIAVSDGCADAELSEEKAPYKNMVEISVHLNDGDKMMVTDYASCGKVWDKENKMATWILTKNAEN